MGEAWRAFDWFLGHNDLGQSLYEPRNGGCYDGLHFDRLNLNQGAESTLAFLLALQEMRRVETTVTAFERPAHPPVGQAVTGQAMAAASASGNGTRRRVARKR